MNIYINVEKAPPHGRGEGIGNASAFFNLSCRGRNRMGRICAISPGRYAFSHVRLTTLVVAVPQTRFVMSSAFEDLPRRVEALEERFL